MNNVKELIVASFVLAASMATAGCGVLVAGAAGGAGVAYFKGDVERNVDHSVEKVYKVSLGAVKNLDMFTKEDKLDTHEAEIKGEFQDGKSFHIKITALTEHSSKLSIRVGVFGDENRSQRILNEIMKKL